MGFGIWGSAFRLGVYGFKISVFGGLRVYKVSGLGTKASIGAISGYEGFINL